MTERRRVEAELREAQRLLEASRDDLRVLAEEQAALRRVATLVAEDVPPSELFGAVAREVGTLFGADFSGMIRYEDDPSVTTVAAWAAAGEHPPLPTHWVRESGDPASIIEATREPARVDDWTSVPGSMATFIRNELAVSSSVACPIVAEGRLWGALAVHSKQSRPLPSDTESRIAQFTDLVGTAIANAESRGRADRLGREQAALRRVATLVAKEASPEEVFAKVAEEVGNLLGEVECVLLRDEGDGTASTVAAWGAVMSARFPVGTRQPAWGDGVFAFVLREGRPRRIDDYSAVDESTAERARDHGIGSAVGYPIVVGGGIWGAIIGASFGAEPCPPETEGHIARFADLVATAIANAETRAEVERLAAEQAALRRVAVLVAQQPSPSEVFTAVTQAVGLLLDADLAVLHVFEGDGTARTIASWSGGGPSLPIGTRFPLDRDNLAARIFESGAPARMHSYDEAWKRAATNLAQSLRMRSAVGAPILVEGKLWGALMAATGAVDSWAENAETRLAAFTELVATAVANAETRAEVERLAHGQAALRRVATLIARGMAPEEVFQAVADEVQALLDVDASGIVRFEEDGTVTVVGANGGPYEPGARLDVDPDFIVGTVRRTGRAARFDTDDPAGADMPAAIRTGKMRSAVANPIVVEGGVWGAIVVGSTEGPVPAVTEDGLADFTELVATALANTDAREQVTALAEEQAALRRVATLVAEGAQPAAVFEAVAAETQTLIGADGVSLSRYEPAEHVLVVAHTGASAARVPPGTRVNHEGHNLTSIVRRTERPARLEQFGELDGAMGEFAREFGVHGSVGVPIIVDGRLWGVTVAIWLGDASPPPDTEARMSQFAGLLDTAIANADSRDQLTASRARLVTAGDEARRRVVRDLHDGAQQRLVHTIVTLKLAQRAFRGGDGKAESLVGEALKHAQQGTAELRELARGILPTVLSRGGLRAGVDAFAARLDLPVQVDVPEERFSQEVEASAYFIVAEALTNVVKHSHAERAEVRASVQDESLQVEVRDDGIGGADPDGHGLVGLGDRATALGGRFSVESPPDGGTLVSATLPLSAG